MKKSKLEATKVVYPVQIVEKNYISMYAFILVLYFIVYNIDV